MKDLNYKIGDIVEMKKEHPCFAHSKQFEIVRIGADIKIKCLGCGNVIMMDRHNFNCKLRNIIKK